MNEPSRLEEVERKLELLFEMLMLENDIRSFNNEADYWRGRWGTK